MAEKGTSTTTYRKKIFCRHPEWLESTKALYNQVLNFYYQLLKEYPDIAALSSQKALRELEKLSIAGRDKVSPAHPLPYLRVPLYFRRAAANAAIAMMHSYREKLKNWGEAIDGKQKTGEPKMAEEICASRVFYKGMYKEFEADSILLKVYTGKSWCWMKCRLKGRKLPREGEWLSPSVVTGKRFCMLHIPVKQKTPDARSVKERMQEGERVCGIHFTNTDAFAVCAILEADGRVIATRFIRGGKEYAHHSKRLLDKIRRDRRVMGKRFDWRGASRKDWVHIRRIREYYAHKASREIVEFCKAYGVNVLAVTQTEGSLPWYILRNLPGHSPMLLSSQIKEKLSYKAWQEGMVITGVRAAYTANKCSICRNYLIKERKPGAVYRCKGGHTGNRELNTAINIGRMSYKKFGKEIKEESMQIIFA